jgi:ABC-type Na+ efflux pump permease subunit
MENKNIIIILVAIVIVLAVIAGAMFLQSGNAKEPTKVKITSDKEQYEGGKLKIKLTDLNKTPISKEIVNITVTNKKGKVVVDDVVKTDSKGKAKLDLNLKKGKYKVNVTYGGNENYTGNNTTQKLKIKKEVKETVVEESSSSSSGSDSGGYDKYSPQYGTYINQYTDSNGVQHIDGVNGMRESYDPNTRIFTYDDGKGHVSSEYR